MTQLDDLQGYTNDNMPLRPIRWRWDNPDVAYDGDPNDGGAPAILSLSPALTYYLQSDGTRWVKEVNGLWAVDGSGGVDRALRTEEAFTVALDSGSGNDPTDGTVIYDQASSDAWGPFKTIPAAVGALPWSIEHLILLQTPDGVWTLDEGGLGDLTRHQARKTPIRDPEEDVGIEITSLNGFEQAAGSPASMAVQTATGSIITLQSDPGLGADAYRTYYLLVLSGTGAGQFKHVRTHAGTSFEVVGTYAPQLDVTSVVQIVTPAATLAIPTLGGGNDDNMTIQGAGMSDRALLRLGRINIVGGNWAWIRPLDITLELTDGLRIIEGGIWGGDTKVLLRTCMIDTSGGWFGFPAVFLAGGSVRQSNPTELFFFRGDLTATQPAIALEGSTGANSTGDSVQTSFLFAPSVMDNWASAFIRAKSKMMFLQVDGPSVPRGLPLPDYAVELENGTAFEVESLNQMDPNFSGATNDVLIDGVGLDWSEIDADADDSAVGGRLSVVYGI